MIRVSGIRKWVVLGVLAAALGARAEAASLPAPGHAHNLMGESVGAAGYDVVSYFPEGGGRPRKGLISISTERDGVTYRFATRENLALFQKSPEKYLPAYGGWCAWAAGEIARRVDVDPESYEIRGGRLYVFYRDPSLDTRAMWLKKADELIRKADANWPELSK